MTSGYDEVFIEHDGAISTVTMNRPSRRNALDVRALEALTLLLEEATTREGVRAVVIRGAGKAFCAGADLPDDVDAAADGPARIDHSFTLRLITRIMTTIAEARVPVLAVVDGPAAGVGASLAFACDIVLATEPSFFLLPFAGIGLIPDGGATLTVAASIGRARALQLAMLGERLPAAQAVEMGLVARMCSREEVDEAAAALAQKLADGATHALAETKRLINGSTISGLRSSLDAESVVQVPLLNSAEHREGVRAFRERRPADFHGLGEG